MKPDRRPERANFSSGPCAKRPGWSVSALADAPLGRSHRSALAKEKLAEVIERSRSVLGIPGDYRVAIVAGSDTGAFELALWSLLGDRPVDVLAWESFGRGWALDCVDQLDLDARILDADYGELPDLGSVDFERDVVFAWNGTTSGVCVPNGDWIPDGRSGLTLCDATSAAFAMPLAWPKLDVVTWSWQKVLGGEAAHGMLVLSPRAVERLESFVPPRPLPKLFRLTRAGQLNESIFEGATINTPSMLCVEDVLDALSWAEAQGGLEALIRRSRANLGAVEAWVERSSWINFLARDPATRASTSICLRVVEPEFVAMPLDRQRAGIKALAEALEREQVAFDIENYRDAPAGLRIWGGATIEAEDVEALLPWLDWAWEQAT